MSDNNKPHIKFNNENQLLTENIKLKHTVVFQTCDHSGSKINSYSWLDYPNLPLLSLTLLWRLFN
jgi:hypothetical protein